MNMLYLKDIVTINNKKYLLSTVELSNLFSEHQVILPQQWSFETALFHLNNQNEVVWSALYCRWYKTIEEAVKGHKDFLKRVQNGEKMPFLD